MKPWHRIVIYLMLCFPATGSSDIITTRDGEDLEGVITGVNMKTTEGKIVNLNGNDILDIQKYSDYENEMWEQDEEELYGDKTGRGELNVEEEPAIDIDEEDESEIFDVDTEDDFENEELIPEDKGKEDELDDFEEPEKQEQVPEQPLTVRPQIKGHGRYTTY